MQIAEGRAAVLGGKANALEQFFDLRTDGAELVACHRCELLLRPVEDSVVDVLLFASGVTGFHFFELGAQLKPFLVAYAGPERLQFCLLYTSPSPRDQRGSRMPSSA